MRASKTLHTQHTQIRQISNLPEPRKHKHTTPCALTHVNIQLVVVGLVSGFLTTYTPLTETESI